MKYYLLNIALATILTLYAALGTQMRFEADDYCHAVAVGEQGAIEYTVSQYETWQGRFSSTFILSGLDSLLSYRAAQILPALLILSMIGAWYYLLLKLCLEYALTLALALTLGFVSGVPNIWQTVYWMSAALNYVPPIIAALWFAGWLLRRLPLSQGSQSQALTNNGA